MCAYTGYLTDCTHMGEHSRLTIAKKLITSPDEECYKWKRQRGWFQKKQSNRITCSCPSKEDCVPLWREAITDRRVEEALENQGPSWPYRKVKMKNQDIVMIQ